MFTGLKVRLMVFPIYNNFTGIKSKVLGSRSSSNWWVAGSMWQAWNDLQISKEWSVKWSPSTSDILSLLKVIARSADQLQSINGNLSEMREASFPISTAIERKKSGFPLSVMCPAAWQRRIDGVRMKILYSLQTSTVQFSATAPWHSWWTALVRPPSHRRHGIQRTSHTHAEKRKTSLFSGSHECAVATFKLPTTWFDNLNLVDITPKASQVVASLLELDPSMNSTFSTRPVHGVLYSTVLYIT